MKSSYHPSGQRLGALVVILYCLFASGCPSDHSRPPAKPPVPPSGEAQRVTVVIDATWTSPRGASPVREASLKVWQGGQVSSAEIPVAENGGSATERLDLLRGEPVEFRLSGTATQPLPAWFLEAHERFQQAEEEPLATRSYSIPAGEAVQVLLDLLHSTGANPEQRLPLLLELGELTRELAGVKPGYEEGVSAPDYVHRCFEVVWAGRIAFELPAAVLLKDAIGALSQVYLAAAGHASADEVAEKCLSHVRSSEESTGGFLVGPALHQFLIHVGRALPVDEQVACHALAQRIEVLLRRDPVGEKGDDGLLCRMMRSLVQSSALDEEYRPLDAVTNLALLCLTTRIARVRIHVGMGEHQFTQKTWGLPLETTFRMTPGQD